MQGLVIDLETGEESRVDLTPSEVAEREQMAEAEVARIGAEDAARADLEARRASLPADLSKVKDPATKRVLELVLLRLGEPSR
jgi:hypothetical protein